MSEEPIRVLIVDDSRTVRLRICQILESSANFQVVGEAENGIQAFEMCRRLKPSVVTMDMVMPEASGLVATEQIMAYCPTPILVVSSSLNRGEIFQTYEALAAGAVDVLDKSSEEDEDAWEGRLLSAIRIASKVRVITHPRGRLSKPKLASSNVRSTRGLQVIAIGASTGGPGAVVAILQALPQNLDVPILLVLHVSEPFGNSIADWLDAQSSYRVRYPVDGELLAQASGVLMAPPSKHMVVQGGRIRLTDEPERHSCRPSVDHLFESLAREIGPKTCACLLTGMGKDGAAGLLALRLSGALTIAQDEESSVVYGMPREAALLGAAQSILPLTSIPKALVDAVMRSK